MRHFKRVKELLVSIGFRHKNRILALIDAGVQIDTLSRCATQTLRIQWKKPMTPEMAQDLKAIAPMRPSTEIYAHDVDKIVYIFEEQKSK